MEIWQGSKAEFITASAAVIAFPFYLGFVHTPSALLALYAGVAGAAMATGEFAEKAHLRHGGFRLFLADVAIWALIIGVLGGATYLFALLF